VETCSAVAENHDGSFEIITWVHDAPRAARGPELAEARAA
jgi:hypothetical protein